MPFKKGQISLNRKPIEWERVGDCIVCTSHARNENGYVPVIRRGKRTLLHRHVCENRYGPLGRLGALHSCDNPACINPEHLRPGTQKDNVRDMHLRKRGHNIPPPTHKGAEVWCSKLSEKDVRDIRDMNGKQREIALRYGVDPSLISRIKRRKYWSWLT